MPATASVSIGPKTPIEYLYTVEYMAKHYGKHNNFALGWSRYAGFRRGASDVWPLNFSLGATIQPLL